MSNIRVLKSKRVIDGYRSIRNGVVVIKDGKIEAVGPQSRTPVPEGAKVTDYGDLIVSPGFIDTHLHGCKMQRAEASLENTLGLAEFVAQQGVTAILPTSSGNTTAGPAFAYEAMQVQKRDGFKGARIAGSHMEGPFWTPKNLPGRPELDAECELPSIERFKEYWEASHGTVLVCDLGIDLPNAFELAHYLHSLGVLVGSAHAKADYNGTMASIENNVTHAIHLFNVMTGLHHRRPGMVGAYLTTELSTAELICDGLTVSYPAMDIAIRCKGYDRICIVTDMTMTGVPDGEYRNDGGALVTVKDGICRLKGSDPSQDNTMNGTNDMRMDVGVRNVYHELGHPLEAAIRMASITPAKIVGIDRYTGSLEVGKSADIAVFDDHINVAETIVGGTTVFKA
jgi:N-acetylglucosamine-6-phosphate deacetylase